MIRKNDPVQFLILGSGWTCKFLIPELRSKQISFSRTRRGNGQTGSSKTGTDESTSHEDEQGQFLPFTLDESITKDSCDHLPLAEVVVIIFPLKTGLIERLVNAYEQSTSSKPIWIALGSTGAWQKAGYASSETPPTSLNNERVEAEKILLGLNDKKRMTTVLNLAGLYGDQRNPVNFAKRACDSREKLQGKTSLHLVHGIDVARAIIGIYEAHKQKKDEKIWGKRWMVTDGYIYDWWELLFTLKPTPIPDGRQWVKELMQEFNIETLPRPCPSKDENPDVPRQLERALDSSSFWQTIGLKPSIGRCDDYGLGGGGATLVQTVGSTSRGAL